MVQPKPMGKPLATFMASPWRNVGFWIALKDTQAGRHCWVLDKVVGWWIIPQPFLPELGPQATQVPKFSGMVALSHYTHRANRPLGMWEDAEGNYHYCSRSTNFPNQLLVWKALRTFLLSQAGIWLWVKGHCSVLSHPHLPWGLPCGKWEFSLYAWPHWKMSSRKGIQIYNLRIVK